MAWQKTIEGDDDAGEELHGDAEEELHDAEEAHDGAEGKLDHPSVIIGVQNLHNMTCSLQIQSNQSQNNHLEDQKIEMEMIIM